MLRASLILQVIFLWVYCQSLPGLEKKTWVFEFISISTNSSDEHLLNFDVKLKRLSRGVYAIHGRVNVGGDIVEGDNTMIEAQVYRSVTGSSEYQPTPYSMKKQHIYDFMNTFYKDIFMNSLSKCSNLPVFKDKFKPPLEKKVYELNNCQISNEGLPPYMSEGYYKISVIGSGRIDYALEAILKVESDI